MSMENQYVLPRTLPEDKVKHAFKVFDSDELYDFQTGKKVIGQDFRYAMANGDPNRWCILIKVGQTEAWMGASEYEVALWKSREAMYGLFKKIREAKSLDEVHSIIDSSRLDQSKIRGQNAEG
jgi:hypothetical protein